MKYFEKYQAISTKYNLLKHLVNELKNEKATINPQNKTDRMCFKYVVTATLNHESTGKHPEKI